MIQIVWPPFYFMLCHHCMGEPVVILIYQSSADTPTYYTETSPKSEGYRSNLMIDYKEVIYLFKTLGPQFSILQQKQDKLLNNIEK